MSNKDAAGLDYVKFIAFRLGEQEFCVDIMSVREIRGWTPTTPLPHAPRFVRGVINLRGVVLPILDLAERLGFPAPEPSARHVIIVVQIHRNVIGLLVDAVSDILTLDSAKIQPTPDVATDVAKRFISGVLAIEGRMISHIALATLVPEAMEQAA